METWYKLDTKAKAVVTQLVDKVDSGSCFDAAELTEVRDNINWYNLPVKMKKVLDIIEQNGYSVSIVTPRWYKLPYTIKSIETFITNFDCELPTVPQNLVSSNITATSVQLDWDASTDNVEVDYYNIYKDGVVTTTRVGTTATISGLTASTTYDFTVSAVDTSGNESAQSAVEQVTTIA